MPPTVRAVLICLPLAGAAGAATTVDLTAEASRPAANDMVRATVFAEASGSNPAELARRVNQDIAEGLKAIKGKAGVSVKSGRQSTFPVYAQNQKIESWRIHSELILESRDAAAVSELLGQLPDRIAVIGIEPAIVRTGIGLSPAVAASVPAAAILAAAVLRQLVQPEVSPCTN